MQAATDATWHDLSQLSRHVVPCVLLSAVWVQTLDSNQIIDVSLFCSSLPGFLFWGELGLNCRARRSSASTDGPQQQCNSIQVHCVFVHSSLVFWIAWILQVLSDCPKAAYWQMRNKMLSTELSMTQQEQTLMSAVVSTQWVSVCMLCKDNHIKAHLPVSLAISSQP